MKKEDKQDRLKKLIQGSATFNATGKKKLLTKASELTPDQMDEAIAVFEREITEVKEIYSNYQKNKTNLAKFTDKSKKEVKKITKKVLKKAEADSKSDEIAKAEKLIANI